MSFVLLYFTDADAEHDEGLDEGGEEQVAPSIAEDEAPEDVQAPAADVVENMELPQGTLIKDAGVDLIIAANNTGTQAFNVSGKKVITVCPFFVFLSHGL